tara:strand:+ start:241 stop:486 length:246 start_codon:yes stop_codon:yes gene_type:complete
MDKYLPTIDKLKHFFLWSIFMSAISLALDIHVAYALNVFTAILWELYQKVIQQGTNSLKEASMDIFYGGCLPVILHLITTI